MTTKLNPPKVPLIFNIGVVGHRSLEDADLEVLKGKVTEVLTEVSSILSFYTKSDHLYRTDALPKLRIISSLGEGSYTLVAKQAFQAEPLIGVTVDLQCPIPFLKEEYIQSYPAANRDELEFLLSKASAVMELPGKLDKSKGEGGFILKNEAYHAVNRVTLDQSDLIIAIWDEKDKPIYKGGIAYVIREAQSKGVPVIWIQAKETLGHQISLRGYSGEWKEGLKKKVYQILLPEESYENKENPAAAYFRENQKKVRYGFIYNLLVSILSIGEKRIGKDIFRHNQTTTFFCIKNFEETGKTILSHYLTKDTTVQGFHGVLDQLTKNLQSHFGWAHGLASYYGGLYRSAWFLRILLVAVTVFSLILGFYGPEDTYFLGFILQTITMVVIISLIEVAKRCKWHNKFIDYRFLAEFYRNFVFTVPLGLGLPRVKIPVSYQNEKLSWLNCCIRAVNRLNGLPNCKIDRTYLEHYNQFLQEKGQKAYRGYLQDRIHQYSLVGKRLTSAGYFLFVLGLITVLARAVVAWKCPDSSFELFNDKFITKNVISTFNLIFTGLATFLFALNSLGEFTKISSRYINIVQSINDLLENPEFTPISFETSANLSDAFAKIRLEEVNDWRMVLEGKTWSHT